LCFDRSRLVELWQIKGEGVRGAGFEQSIDFVVIRSGHKKDVKRTRQYSDTRKCRKEFQKYIMGFSEKHRVIFSKRLVNTKVIWGGPKPDVLIFSSFCRLFGQKIVPQHSGYARFELQADNIPH